MPDLPALALFQVPGLMVVNEEAVGRPDGLGDQRGAMICAHEVAHLWFGCLVGPRWWDDVWLDEAIATYLSYAALAAVAGVSQIAVVDRIRLHRQADGISAGRAASRE